MLLHGLRSTLRRHIRRRRRLLAAVLAAAAVVVGLSSLDRSPVSAEAISTGDPGAHTALAAGQVAVPIELASSSLVQALAVGDVIDVVGLGGTERPAASVLAAQARVIDLPATGAFGTTSSSVVVVSIDERDALEVSTAAASGGLSVLIRERAPR